MTITIGLLLSAATQADIINVPADQPTIQAGIDAASDGDEVVVAPGTYFELIDFLGKAVTVRSSDGPDVTIVHAGRVPDPGTGKPVVRCDKGEGPNSVLDGFTLTLGTGATFPSSPTRSGGGMFNLNSSPTVTNCTFIRNTASGGGLGGGMYNSGGSPTVTNCTFIRNSGGTGGGMCNSASSPTVTNCTFTGNRVSATGGGMVNNNGSSPTVTNCTFSGNRVTAGMGGGMCNFASSPTVTNCTFSGNSARKGGGMHSSGGSPTVINCIFWNDSRNEISAMAPGRLEGSGMATLSYCNVEGGFAGVGNIDTDPLFSHPDSGDFHLSAGSPCIDAADNTAVPADISDLDGNARFVDDPSTEDTGMPDPKNPKLQIVDMGAFEFQAGTTTRTASKTGPKLHENALRCSR